MIDFLSECNIRKETIDELNRKLSPATLFSLNGNEYEIKKIILYLKGIGVKPVDEILINYTHLFFNTLKEFTSIFEKYDINKLVEFINKDFNVLAQL